MSRAVSSDVAFTPESGRPLRAIVLILHFSLVEAHAQMVDYCEGLSSGCQRRPGLPGRGQNRVTFVTDSENESRKNWACIRPVWAASPSPDTPGRSE